MGVINLWATCFNCLGEKMASRMFCKQWMFWENCCEFKCQKIVSLLARLAKVNPLQVQIHLEHAQSVINHYMEKVFHNYCFVCTRCKGSIQSRYGIIDGQPYCKACVTKIHSEKHQQTPEKLCGSCGERLSGSCVPFQGKICHKDCFKPPKLE